MSPFLDLLLRQSMPQTWLQVLLFAGFSLHLLFVLMTLGTALLSVYSFIESGRQQDDAGIPWDRRILRVFMAHKSIAVVLGVAPLLLIQTGHAVPFFNATSLLAPYWMLIIVFLIPASLIFDYLGHGARVRRSMHLVLSAVALVFLLSVPAVFVAVLIAAEQPASWLDIVRQGYKLTGALGLHWFLRYLHVLASGIIFGALFHYFFTSGGDKEKRAKMANWILLGVLSQLVIGPMLALTLPLRMDGTSSVFLGFGLGAVSGFVWLLAKTRGGERDLSLRSALPVLLAIALLMLLVRQHQQDRAFSGLEEKARANSLRYASLLEPYQRDAVDRYRKDVQTVYDNGETIYSQSCAFCHNENGDGHGPEAKNLEVQPEGISLVRATRGYVYEILTSGVEGTGMPYFTVFVRDKLERLIDLMNERWGIIGLPPPLADIPPEDAAEAEKVYGQVCAGCHGQDGRPTPAALKFKPPPPDFTRYSLMPQRAFEVISEGYHGTLMAPFGQQVTREVRMALIQVIYSKRKPSGFEERKN